MEILLAALAAALLGAAGPAVMARLPEPQGADDQPADDVKPLYRDIARAPRLAAWLAAASALAAGVAAWRLEDVAYVPVWVLLAGVGSWLTYIDWRTRYLPFLVTMPLHLGVLALVGVAALLQQSTAPLVRGLVGNVVVFVVFWLVYQLGRRFGGAFGYGDVRLGAVLGLALGALGQAETLAGLYAGFGLGAVLGLVLSRLGVVDAKGFAFGPYLVVGAFVGVVVGPLL